MHAIAMNPLDLHSLIEAEMANRSGPTGVPILKRLGQVRIQLHTRAQHNCSKMAMFCKRKRYPLLRRRSREILLPQTSMPMIASFSFLQQLS